MNDKTVFRNPLKIQTLLDALQTIIDEEPDVYPDYRRVTLREAKEWLSDCYRMVELYQDRIVPGFRERLAKRVEVVHGRWEDSYKGRFANCKYICSVCRKTAHSDDWQWSLSPYCPNCGAKMDGEKDG